MNKTALTTRNELIQSRQAQAVKRVSDESSTEISRQLRDSFMIQSAETSALVETLFAEHGLQIKRSLKETPLPQEVINNDSFTLEFSKLRGMADYIRLIANYGYMYCLTGKQCGDLADILGIHKHRKRLAVSIAHELENSLEQLWQKTKEPPIKSLKLGKLMKNY